MLEGEIREHDCSLDLLWAARPVGIVDHAQSTFTSKYVSNYWKHSFTKPTAILLSEESMQQFMSPRNGLVLVVAYSAQHFDGPGQHCHVTSTCTSYTHVAIFREVAGLSDRTSYCVVLELDSMNPDIARTVSTYNTMHCIPVPVLCGSAAQSSQPARIPLTMASLYNVCSC